MSTYSDRDHRSPIDNISFTPSPVTPIDRAMDLDDNNGDVDMLEPVDTYIPDSALPFFSGDTKYQPRLPSYRANPRQMCNSLDDRMDVDVNHIDERPPTPPLPIPIARPLFAHRDRAYSTPLRYTPPRSPRGRSTAYINPHASHIRSHLRTYSYDSRDRRDRDSHRRGRSPSRSRSRDRDYRDRRDRDRGGRDDRDRRDGRDYGGYASSRRDDRYESSSRRSPVPAHRVAPTAVPPKPAPKTQPNNVVGIFGLSIRTTERDLEDEFGKFGPVEKVVIVYDQRTDRSRGFGFVTMRATDDAARAVERMNASMLHGRQLRVDFSATQKAHAPTPGEYKGQPRAVAVDDRYNPSGRPGRDGGDKYDGRRDRDRSRSRDRRDRRYDDRDRSRDRDSRRRERSPYGRRRSPSPRRRHSRSPDRKHDNLQYASPQAAYVQASAPVSGNGSGSIPPASAHVQAPAQGYDGYGVPVNMPNQSSAAASAPVNAPMASPAATSIPQQQQQQQ